MQGKIFYTFRLEKNHLRAHSKTLDRKTSTTILKAIRQKHRSLHLYGNEKNGLQQFQMESCQPIKRLKDKKKRKKKKIEKLKLQAA